MRRTIKAAICCGLLAATLAGCGGSGSNYVGDWVSLKNECATISIKKNGDHFIIHTVSPGFFGLETYNFPGTLVDGVMQMNVQSGVVSLLIDQKSGNIITPKVEYQRLQGVKKDCSKK